ncbi:MAG: T9SS type A sorting domain-containing protein [Bacteroidales bacterium]|nr:T9SS type A sorting domain-containing protein [Bacteroidales bacterium]
MKRLFFTTMMLLWVTFTFGQLTGTKTIPGDYATLADAITDLNTQGVGPGGVTIELTAGNPETAPSGGYSITASGTPNSPILIKGNGNTITSSASLTVGALNDAFFKIIGGDYITIDGFVMQENAANTTTTASSNNMTEFGVALFYASTTDGPQHCTIQNNDITLGAAYQNAFGIYANSRHTSTNMTSTADITAQTGAFSYLNINHNTISSVNLGIVLVGSPTTAYMATDVQVNNNTITFGRTGTFSSYVSVSGSVNGIYINNCLNVTVNTNTITCNGTSTAGTLRGIYHNNTGTLPTTGTYVNTYNYNTISLTNGTSTATYGIHLDNLNAQFTTNVNGNTINYLNSTVASSAVAYGIYQQSASLNEYFNGNIFQLTPNTTGTVAAIYANNTMPTSGTVTANNNDIQINKNVAGGTVYGYYSNASSPAGVVKTFDHNIFHNISLTGATSFYGFYDADGGAPTKIYSNNSFQNITGGTSAITCIYTAYGIHHIFNNILQTISNGAAITGITAGGTNSTLANTYNNFIAALSTSSGSINAINITASGTNAVSNVYNNIISGISAGGTSSTVGGISISAGTNISVYNNVITELYTPSASSTTPSVAGIAAINGTNVNLYYNTIYLDATSTGVDFSTAALYVSTTPANVKLVNNIFVNNSTPNGTGRCVALQRAETALAKYVPQSNNNLFYAGTPSANNLIYYDGTNAYQTIGDFQTAVSPRETASISNMPPFVNTITHPYDLHIQTTVSTGIESGGQPIPGIDTDAEGDIRQGSTGYAGTGIAPDMGADEFNGVANFTCTTPTPGNTVASNTSVCFNDAINLSLENAVPGTGITYQWKKSTDGTNYTDMPSATSATVNNYTITEPTYFMCDVTCANGPVTVSSTPIFVDFANKILTTTPDAICGAGQANLEATATAGSTINWYDAPTGGNLVGTGSPFTTPIIASTTNYYVAAETTNPAVATVGTGSTTSTSYESPFYHFYGGLKSQYLILASELQAAGFSAGTINSLAFDVVANGTTYQDFNFSIGATSNNALTTTFESGLTNVYSNPAYTLNTGINTITFTTPYNWDGISNLVVEFCWSNNNAGGTSATVKYDNTTYAAQAYYRVDNTPASTLCATTLATATQNKRPKFIINGQAICSSPRIAVTATVSSSTPITITSDATVCNNEVKLLEVTAGASNYNQFTWLPNTNLFTDAACTSPYTGGNNQQVYMKTNVAGTYQFVCNAYNTTTECGATDTVYITVLPASVTLTASPSNICLSGSTVLTVTPTTGFGTATFQFAESADGNSYTDISGANGFTYSSGILNSNTYYQWTASVGGNTCIQEQTLVMVNNPTITSTTPGSACGQGTITLSATANSGSTILWYDSLNAVYPIASGNSFITPLLTATEDYYVEPIIENLTFNLGPISDIPSAFASYGNYGMYFATTSAAVINSVDIYPSTAGTLNVVLVNNLGQVVNGRSFTITSGDISTTTKKTLNLDFFVPANATGWMLYYDLAIYRGSGTYAYPYSANGFSITGNTFNGNNITGGTRMYFYNWDVTTFCSGSRDQIVATITPAPPVSINSSASDVCANSAVTLTANSSNNDYTYAWSTGDNGQIITVNPPSSATFVVTATDPNTGCITTAETFVNVYPLPVATATVDNATITCGQTVQLTAGDLYSPEILLENYNGTTHSMTTVNTSTGGNPAAAAWTLRPDGYVYSSNTFHSPDNSQFIMSNSDAQGSGGTTHTELISMPFSSVGVDSVTIMMDHFYRHYTNGTAKVEIFDGTQWTTLQTWTSDQGNFTNFAHVVLPLNNSYLNNPNLQIRFVYDQSFGYYWAIDNAGINLYHANTLTWTSTPLGFSSNIYNPTDAPTATTEYNVVVTSSNNCTNTASVTVTVNNLPAPIVTVNNLCGVSELIASNYTGTLLWSTNETTDTITVTTNNPITVTYTDGACTSDAATATPAPIEIPTIPTVAPVTACFGETVDAFVASSNYNDFVWYADAGLTIPIGNGNTFQSQETNPGTYTYYVVALNGTCASDAATAMLTIFATPTVTITQNADTLYSSSNSGNQWHNSQGPIAGATDTSYVVTTEDDYYVVVTDANGCSAMSNSIHVIPTAIAQNQFASMISVSPNPAHNYTVVNLGSLNNAKIEIVAADGKVVYNASVKKNIETISLNGFATGLYTVKVTTDGKTIQKKLVVE